MRYFKILLGLIKIYLTSFFTVRNLKFKFPIRLEKGVFFSLRKNSNIILGKHISICHNAGISVTENALIKIGDYCGIGDNNIIVARKKIEIGNNVMIGPNVCIYDHDHIYKEKGIMRDLGYNTAPVKIEDNVWIGAGVIVLKGVTIGSGSVVAAGTVVTKDIPKNSIVYNEKEIIIKSKFKEI